ncbi:VOC family protein [Kaistia geumhonensis]|uniref:Glyoxalase superfamily protein PhnB n=1 Tax=Kaistia geumhonensis TaxID=410839 RepID=A0ABU0M2Y4_9HYPH|nr:VOC family protein [Kaistia geumhonensis]MCX5479468.1 VOC family protein [Kaistia geumhonensis]MDQ0515309.1 putative glyoxalase superfamily protein PhnB [Kaistia geumhonensis]
MSETAVHQQANNTITGVVPYLSVDGAVAAAELYKRAFGAEELARQPLDEKGRTMHIHLRIHGGSVMLCDFYPEYGHEKQAAQGYTLHLQVADPDMWWRRAEGAGLTVVNPLQTMFWGDRYGQLRDSFGVMWSIGGT